MIIKDNSNNEQLSFKSLEVEDIFKFDDRLFMKTNALRDDQNAFDLSKHRMTDISLDTLVNFVPSELILHERGWNNN